MKQFFEKPELERINLADEKIMAEDDNFGDGEMGWSSEEGAG